MKKILSLMTISIMIFMLTSCVGNSIENSPESTIQSEKNNTKNEKTTNEIITIKTSPDKYTWYVKNYVGRNLASFGYTSFGNDRMDEYGNGYIKISLINQSGHYIDVENEDELKKYVVTAQNFEPNTEVKHVFEKDNDGNEYDNLVVSQTVEEILLYVKEAGILDEIKVELTEINTSPDIYTHYVRDYVGRNLKSCGYLSLGGQFRDSYGAATVVLQLISDDGSYIDVNDVEMLKKYKIIAQSVEPNTELKLELMKDEEGNEYYYSAENQNIEEIELYVSLID